MAVAIDTSFLALYVIPEMQRELDGTAGGQRRFQILRVSAYATIPSSDAEIWRQMYSALQCKIEYRDWVVKREALSWQADRDDNLGDAAVLHHLHQQAATVPLLSCVFSRNDHSNAATTLTGSALSASINAKTQGRLLSSLHRYSYRLSCLSLRKSVYRFVGKETIGSIGFSTGTKMTKLLPSGAQDPTGFAARSLVTDYSQFIVWAGPKSDHHLVFWQLQVDVVDLFSRRTVSTSRPGKRPRPAFNSFLQVSDSPVGEDTSRGNSLLQAKRFNGVRHRPDRNIWVAEMKPPKHQTKQDFGNFKSEAEAALAVDAAFHYYGKPLLLNFPDTSLQFLSTRPTAPPGLDEKAKVRFVMEEAKLLLAAMADSSPFHPTPLESLPFPIQELSASPRRYPSGQFRSLSEISSPFGCSDPDEVDDVVSQPQPWTLLESICDIPTTGVLTNLETLNSVQNAEQGWDWFEESSTVAAPPNVVNPSACEIQSMWLDSLIRSPPAPSYSRSPSPSHFQEEIAYASAKDRMTFQSDSI